jgi:hypothetical protein
MFFKKKNALALKVLEVEKQLAQNPLAAVEVDAQTAEYMGAFIEDAVELEDFAAVEAGALDWFFRLTANDADSSFKA